MSDTPLFPDLPRTEPFLFVPGFATRPRIVWTPGAKGSRIHAINVSSSDAGANTVQFGIAKRVTQAANMGTGHITDGGAGSDTVTRTSGQFTTDGWRAGERLFIEDATTLANDLMAILSAVSTTTLTLPTGTVAADEDLPAAANLYRLGLLGYIDVPAGSGKPSVLAVSGLDIAKLPMLDDTPDRYLTLGPNELLVAYLGTALTGAETLDLAIFGFDY